MTRLKFIPIALVTVLLGFSASVRNERQGNEPPVEFTEDELRRIFTLSPPPAPPADPTNRFSDRAEAAALGHLLFFDAGLAADGKTSCATCHIPTSAFTDNKAVSEGAQTGTRNTPTLLNVVHQRWLFWDGRADSLWSQALSPLESAIEMNSDRLHLARHVRADAVLRDAYEQCFGSFPALPPDDELPAHARPMPDEPDHALNRAWQALTDDQRAAIDTVFVNVGKAIAAYERQLVTGPSPFDRFVEALRNKDAVAQRILSPAAQHGVQLFVGKAGCRDCHNGPLLTDFEFHSIGVPARVGRPPDSGRYGGIATLQQSLWRADGSYSDDVSGIAALRSRSLIRSPETWGQFRTPSLRNVVLTAPYMHQGQYADLRAVLEHYSTLTDAENLGHHQEQVLTPLNLTEREIADLTAFLESLTGSMPHESLMNAPIRHCEDQNE